MTDSGKKRINKEILTNPTSHRQLPEGTHGTRVWVSWLWPVPVPVGTPTCDPCSHKLTGSNRFEQVQIFFRLLEPWTELSVQFSMAIELWTELRSSSERFRFELRSRTELRQH